MGKSKLEQWQNANPEKLKEGDKKKKRSRGDDRSGGEPVARRKANTREEIRNRSRTYP